MRQGTMEEPKPFAVVPIGSVHSVLKERSGAPKQGREGAPDAHLEITQEFVEGLDGIKAGDEILVLTWLHQSRRETLKVRPRFDPQNALTGVFQTRSPDRPNPIGLHRVTVLAVDGRTLHVQPLEAIDGTPVVDIKPVLDSASEG
jgi:tRNA-Thr(GGU) m(6)t(6)A37 methyltransferase TsaA